MMAMPPILRPRRLIFLALGLALILLLLFPSIDVDLLFIRIKQVDIEVERRIQRWDWKDTAEEQYCRAPHNVGSKDLIPNVAHFIMLSSEGKESNITFAQFLAIKAAVVAMKASEVKIHTYGLDVENRWWQELQNYVTLAHLGRNEVPGPHGLLLKDLQLAHQADILRLHVLQREGGIYFDTDMYPLKPFTDLLSNPRDTILGHEGGNRWGLCNAVIVSRPNSSFLSKWQEAYKTFSAKGWNEHSVQVPKRLQVQKANRELICPLSPSVFFWPTWSKSHVRYMHEPLTDPKDVADLRASMRAYGGAMYENQLAIHAWQAKEYLARMTPESIQTEDTRFNMLLKEIAAAPW